MRSYVAMSGESQSDCPLWKSSSAHIAAVSDAQCRKRGEGLLCGNGVEKHGIASAEIDVQNLP